MEKTVKYYGWIGGNGYDGLVKIVDNSEAYVFNKEKKDFHRSDEYLKAAFDPGSDFEEISEEEANDLIEGLTK